MPDDLPRTLRRHALVGVTSTTAGLRTPRSRAATRAWDLACNEDRTEDLTDEYPIVDDRPRSEGAAGRA